METNLESKEKLKELIVYICEQNRKNPRFSLDHIILTLWSSDSLNWAKHGKSITGQTYFKHPRGPIARDFAAALGELLIEGRIGFEGKEKFSPRIKRLDKRKG